MIIYKATKAKFQQEVLFGGIEDRILEEFQRKLHRTTSRSEIESWRDSLMYMRMVLEDSEIPDDAGVYIETGIPQTSKRIDFIVAGKNQNGGEEVVIIELKRWQTADITEMDAIVRTALGGSIVATSHPSYQAWSYAALLEDFSEVILTDKISLRPCAYLHNYNEDEVIRNQFYEPHISKAPVFLKHDATSLQSFIKNYVKEGDTNEVMSRIEKSRLRPSKKLADSLASMIEGNQEFTMIDDQKVVFETALNLSTMAHDEGKQVLIVEGGPGTGKSVVAINLLVELTKKGLLTNYVTKNAAPRQVYKKKLTGSMTKTRFDNIFRSSGSFHSVKENKYGALIIDEAHRLNEKSGMYSNLGENQVKELIRAAESSVFFIDEDQRIHLKDIGTKEEIIKWSREYGVEPVIMELSSQFRCSGSDGYLAWLDHVLQIRETANIDLDQEDFEFEVFDSPSDLRDLIFEKNKENNNARMVAGYCWDWKSKRNRNLMDFEREEFGFEMQWNLDTYGAQWIQMPNSVNEIGCIHTCQGLEIDYIGVIIGRDLIVRNGVVIGDPSMRSKNDASVKGWKKMMKEKPEEAQVKLEKIIKNTYRTLMTRGMKGCYVHVQDDEAAEYIKGSLTSQPREN